MDKSVKLAALIAGIVVALAAIVVLVMRLNAPPSAPSIADSALQAVGGDSPPAKPGEIPAAERATMDRESQGIELTPSAPTPK